MLQDFPLEITNFHQLEMLYLNGNYLFHIPPQIGQLTNLHFMTLYDNLLTSLPTTIGNLSHLCLLDLGGNRFETIPTALHRLNRFNSGIPCPSPMHFRSHITIHLDDYLYETIPDEVAAGGTGALLDYLENKALWHTRRLLIAGVSGVSLIAGVGLFLVWRYRTRRKPKKKRSA